MEELYLIGGQQKYLRPLFADDSNWYEYDKGVVLRFNLDREQSELLVKYTSPAESRAENGTATLFKSASSYDDLLYVCTQTEVLVYSLPEFVQIAYISLPCFNDVHHVCPTPEGNLAVASSGLDMVVEVNMEGKVLREWSALGEDPWLHFSNQVDYRQLSTKPHKAHPNFLFFIDDEMWTTRLVQKDAVCLRDVTRRIEITVGSPHDGLVQGDYIYFSTANGYVSIVNKRTLKVEETLNLNDLHDYNIPLGWCRGLMVDQDKLWVGFSRIRPTKIRENVEWLQRNLKTKLSPLLPAKYVSNSKWIKGGSKRDLPSHIACYDLIKRRCLSEFNLESHGISVIYSIFSGAKINARKQDTSSITDGTLNMPQDFPST